MIWGTPFSETSIRSYMYIYIVWFVIFLSTDDVCILGSRQIQILTNPPEWMVCLEVVTATGFDVKGDFAWSSAKLFFLGIVGITFLIRNCSSGFRAIWSDETISPSSQAHPAHRTKSMEIAGNSNGEWTEIIDDEFHHVWWQQAYVMIVIWPYTSYLILLSAGWQMNTQIAERTQTSRKSLGSNPLKPTLNQVLKEVWVNTYMCVCAYMYTCQCIQFFAFAIVYLQSKMVPRSNIVFSELYIYNTNA